jgi:hypothetical protein
MIIPDVNLLLYANIDAGPQHAAARLWFERLFTAEEPIGFTPAVLLGFVRLSTSRRVFLEPLSVADAVARTQAWLDQPQAAFLELTKEVVQQTLALLREVGAAGNLTTDAQLAAHALIHRATVASADGDFDRFPRVKWMNPLRPR